MKAREINPVNIARFVEQEVYEGVLEFHARSNYTNILGVNTRCYLSSANEKTLATLVQTETPLWAGFTNNHKLSVERSVEATQALRDESANSFVDKEPLKFKKIEQLVADTFTTRGALSNKRAYPSGGALYPIEIFICKLSKNIEEWPVIDTVLHVLPLSKSLEGLEAKPISELLQALSGNNEQTIGSPYFAIVYTIFFEKAIFKYRYRGYRLALLEAGSMYQMADLFAKNLGLRSRMWAGFTDYQVAKLLGINYKHIAPLAVQFFGKAD